MTSTAPGHAADLATLRQQLAALGQDHVLAFEPDLSTAHRESLRHQLASLDFAAIPALIAGYVKNKPKADLRGSIEPASAYPLNHADPRKPWDRAAYRQKGEQLVREGKVAAFTVAGGQGSRLGFEGPKGCFPGGAVTNKPLFACLADWILAAQNRFAAPGVVIPWYIMTSPGNHDATITFFRQHRFFGLRECDVRFFPQGVMPAFEMGSGKMLLSDKHELALSPDGHGGSLRALFASGALADMRKRGVEHLSYTQIDNPLVRVIDPTFLGLHAFAPDSSGEMSSKMVPKASAGEKVGVFCKVDGKTTVIEYSDMPADLSNKTLPDGSLAFSAGSIAVHAISVAFIERLNDGSGASGFSLPYHRAEKKVPCIDHQTGKKHDPAHPNAIKLETFVFDALPLCNSSIVVETLRNDEFAPIKNATGPDSVETCKLIQTERAARWLEAAGCAVPRHADGRPDCLLELSPLTAMDADDLKFIPLPRFITPGANIAL